MEPRDRKYPPNYQIFAKMIRETKEPGGRSWDRQGAPEREKGSTMTLSRTTRSANVFSESGV